MSWRRGPTINRTKWRKVRLLVLDRDGWVCRRCGKLAQEVDHILSLNLGGEIYDPLNCQALCKKCHLNKTRRENQIKPTPAEVQEWRRFVNAM